jgi:putative copper resistance protein D
VTNDQQGGHAGGGWEGSSAGIAYSEFNHHFAGLCDVLFGLAELGYALRLPLPFWIRLILPGALGVIGMFLLVWSDHDAWPIGSLGFVETFSGQDREIVEHKLYGVLAVAIAFSEMLRRIGWARHPVWAAPLVFLTLVGGLLLFVHSHGNHPASARIEFHHALLGSVGVGAALSKGLASWLPGASRDAVKRWEIAWAGSVILFGLLLLVYSE